MMVEFLIEIIQSICLIIAAIIILITAIGILRLNDDIDKVIYVRIHMLGMVDIACVLAMIGLGQFLLAGIYFVLAPFVAHALANAYYYGEDDRKYESNDDLTGRINDNDYNRLAIAKNRKLGPEFKDNFENKHSNNSINSSVDLKSESNESKNFKSDTKNSKSINNVTIKEVSTDDIENSNLDGNRGEDHD